MTVNKLTVDQCDVFMAALDRACSESVRRTIEAAYGGLIDALKEASARDNGELSTDDVVLVCHAVAATLYHADIGWKGEEWWDAVMQMLEQARDSAS